MPSSLALPPVDHCRGHRFVREQFLACASRLRITSGVSATGNLSRRDAPDSSSSFETLAIKPTRQTDKGLLARIGEAPEALSRQALEARDARSNTAKAATWEEIEILFLSDERVQILNGTNRETRNYAEFGFADGRTSGPNQAWGALRAMAQQRGVLQVVDPRSGAPSFRAGFSAEM